MKPIPNLLTAVRLCLIPFYLSLLWSGRPGPAALVYILALITDVDGTIARRWGATSKFGALFDPIVDGIFMFVAFGSLIVLGTLPLIPVALYVVSVLFRALPMLAHFRATSSTASTFVSKAVAFCGFGSVLLGTLGTPVPIISAVLIFGTIANVALTILWLRTGRFQLS